MIRVPLSPKGSRQKEVRVSASERLGDCVAGFEDGRQDHKVSDVGPHEAATATVLYP